VVSVAFEAAGLGVIGPGGVAGFAVGDARDEDVGGFGAGESFFVAVEATEAAMGIVIEFGVRKPLFSGNRRGDGGQRIAGVRFQAMALLAGFSPQQFLGIGGAFGDPLCRRENANFGRKRFAG